MRRQKERTMTMKEITAVITQEKAKISCNFEQVKQAIQETLAEYRGAVFTEDSKTYAKKHVASLRAKKKDLQDNLREAKKEYMKPWDEFEGQAKELISMYDEPIDLINGQVQAFEENRIAKKKELIHGLYEALVPEELRSYIPLDRIYNKKWENATVKEKDIRGEMSGIAAKTEKDIGTIKDTESDAVDGALSVYRVKLDLTEALSYLHNYERQKQEILAKEQERRRLEEEERIRREEREKALAEQRAIEEKEAAARREELEKEQAIEQARKEATQEFIDSLIPDSAEESELYEYRIALSADAKNKLEMYMDSIGIEWEVIS
ncbi:DUF1351 domain-containing protein [bacterium 1XD8-76]|nr:DUF1351 domain-containing protein [bacterium 1XD8-76]